MFSIPKHSVYIFSDFSSSTWILGYGSIHRICLLGLINQKLILAKFSTIRILYLEMSTYMCICFQGDRE